MLIVASVLICVGCFLADPRSETGKDPGGSGDLQPVSTLDPSKIENTTPTPDNTATATPDAAETTPPPEETPAESEWPRIEFPDIKNVDFMQYDTKFDHFTTYWKTGDDNQNLAVINGRVLEIIKNIDYVFYTIGDDEDWDHYMTFSLHYDYGYAGKVLDLLKKYDIKAVFFVTKRYIAENPDIVRRMKEEGHIIGNRGIIDEDTISKLTPETFAQGLLEVEQEYQKLFGYTERMYLFRTDYFNERLLKVAEAMGYTVVFRTYTYYSDYKDKTAEQIAERFNARALYNGTISEFTVEPKCYEALQMFLPNAIDQGVSFKLVQRRH